MQEAGSRICFLQKALERNTETWATLVEEEVTRLDTRIDETEAQVLMAKDDAKKEEDAQKAIQESQSSQRLDTLHRLEVMIFDLVRSK